MIYKFEIWLASCTFIRLSVSVLSLLLSCCNPIVPQTVPVDLKWQIDVTNGNEKTITGNRIILLANSADNNYEGFSHQLRLTKTMDQLDLFEIWQNDILVFSEQYYQATVAGLCVSPDSNRPVFFIDSVDEGLGNGGKYHHVLAQDPQNQWRVAILGYDIGPETGSNRYVEDFINCKIRQNSVWANFQSNAGSQPCVCNFGHELFAPSEAEKWQEVVPQEASFSLSIPESFIQGQTMPLPMQLIENQGVIAQLIEGARANTEYQIETYTANKHTFVNIEHDADELNPFAYSFIQKESLWYVWDVAGNSSKGFHSIQHIKQPIDGRIQLQACTYDCHWWGKYAELELNLTTLSIKYLKEVSD